MSLTRSALISQFLRDCQALRDALIGLTTPQISDPTFNSAGSLRARLSLVAAHYYRIAEALAYRLQRQYDAPLEEDEAWRKEAINDRREWSLVDLQGDLEDAWVLYGEMLHILSDEDIEWFVRNIPGALTRAAFDASREVSAWRLRSS